MADFDFSKDSSDPRVLMVAFTQGTPLNARELAEVLRALDSDYRDLTGRGLVLGRMETGSTWMWVYDALVAVGGVTTGVADIAKAIDDITSFGLKLKDAFTPKKSLLPKTAMKELSRTIKQVAKASKKHKSEVLFKKAVITDQGSETIEIKVTPVEALAARQRLDDNAVRYNAIATHHIQRESILEEMRKLPYASNDTELIISTLVRTLGYTGNTNALAQVADVLAREGRSDLAEIIWRQIGRGRGQLTVET